MSAVKTREETQREAVVDVLDNRLAERLAESGMSLLELHRRIVLAGEELSYDTLIKIKNKKRTDIMLSTAGAICNALGLTLDEVFPLAEPSRNGRTIGERRGQ